MRRRWTFVALVAVLLTALAGSLTGTTAQEEGEHEEEERSPLTGGWVVTTPDVEGAPPALYTFTAEGNLLQTGPRGVATGVWEAEGEDGAIFTIVFFVLDAQGRYIRETVNGTLALQDGDDAFVAAYSTVGVDPDGQETFRSDGTAQGERIVVGGSVDDPESDADADATGAETDEGADSERQDDPVEPESEAHQPDEGTPEGE